MLLRYLKIIFDYVSMTEENILYEDSRYKFYEDRIYSKTRFQYLQIMVRRDGNGRGQYKDTRVLSSFITKGPASKGVRTVLIRYPLTMEKINSVYLS